MSLRTQTNRNNAQYSTGPKTEAGKHRSSLNALGHGLTSQVVVMPGEDLLAYRRHTESFIDEYAPRDPPKLISSKRSKSGYEVTFPAASGD